MSIASPDLFRRHLELIQQRWEDALALAGFDAAVIDAGSAALYFQDDQTAPFRPNPHFAQWFPSADCEHAQLLIRPGGRPALFFYQPEDYWHLPPAAPEWVTPYADLQLFADRSELQRALQAAVQRINRTAYVGAAPQPDLPTVEHNPALLLNPLNYQRAYKTAFELQCMATATTRAVQGHLAARTAFHAGASEFGIHMAYLAASEQTGADLPYSNIVALNEHAGVLHYQHYERAAPATRHSFLIDAGAAHQGYAADITRTYAADPRGRFAELIERLDHEQQTLIAGIRPGQNYVALHEVMHRRIASVLVDSGLATGSADAVFAAGATTAFLPHGLGHLLGLQVHDVGGQQTRPEGGLQPPPDAYPALRLTRNIELEQVFTIEPGLYFIPMLLAGLRSAAGGKLICWPAVEELLPCGGIRIEDNVVVRATDVLNLTRNAFAAAEASAP